MQLTLFKNMVHVYRSRSEFRKNYKDFTNKLKRSIRARDKHTCHMCWVVGSAENKGIIILDVHHINYNKKDNAADNLITLCHSCHTKTNYHRVAHQIHFRRIMTQIIDGTWVIPKYKEPENLQMVLFGEVRI